MLRPWARHYPHCFSRLSCELSTRWGQPREWCSVLWAFRSNSIYKSRIFLYELHKTLFLHYATDESLFYLHCFTFGLNKIIKLIDVECSFKNTIFRLRIIKFYIIWIIVQLCTWIFSFTSIKHWRIEKQPSIHLFDDSRWKENGFATGNMTTLGKHVHW